MQDAIHTPTSNDHLDASEGARPMRTITVEFNFVSLNLPKERMTGAEIKAAAIAAGLPIEPGFVLSVARHGDNFEVVGDDETVKIRKGLSFTCVAADDNS